MKYKWRDFSGGPVVKNPPCNAGDLGSIPDWITKIPHATGQLSQQTTTRVQVLRWKIQNDPRKIPRAANEIGHSQISKFKKLKNTNGKKYINKIETHTQK